MCDYSMHAVQSRPAEVGEKLITSSFRNSSTSGFAAQDNREVAVCLLPGTELAFEEDVKFYHRWIWSKSAGFRVAQFCTIDPHLRDRRGAAQCGGAVHGHRIIENIGIEVQALKNGQLVGPIEIDLWRFTFFRGHMSSTLPGCSASQTPKPVAFEFHRARARPVRTQDSEPAGSFRPRAF